MLTSYRFNHNSWMTVVTQTHLPKVRNGCVIEVFDGDFVLSPGFHFLIGLLSKDLVRYLSFFFT